MAVNKCDPIMKDAFRGIELNYKLNSAIASLPRNQKFSAEQLENMLKKAPHNVSPYEIKASRLFDNFRGDNRTFTAEEWDQMNLGQQMFSTRVGGNDYIDITLGKKGEESGTYYTKEFMAAKQDKSTNLRHRFHDADESRPTNELLQLRRQLDDLVQSEGGNKNLLKTMKTEEYKDLYSKIRNLEESEAGYIHAPSYDDYSQLGWNRVHQDEINGKPTTILNELQSDWLQAERQGAGTFESKFGQKRDKYLEELGLTLEDFNELGPAELVSLSKTREQEDFFMSLGRDGIIADFPMKPEKFHQLMIVDAINEAIENGTNRVAIPIERENELMGSAGVTKFYDSLNKKGGILDIIRKKLDKQGLEIKLGKEAYTTGSNKLDDIIEKIDNNLDSPDLQRTLEDFASNDWEALGLNSTSDYPFDGSFDEIIYGKSPDDLLDIALETLNWLNKHNSSVSNELHIIEITQKPKTPVRWDVYALISALGLTDQAIELSKEEN